MVLLCGVEGVRKSKCASNPLPEEGLNGLQEPLKCEIARGFRQRKMESNICSGKRLGLTFTLLHRDDILAEPCDIGGRGPLSCEASEFGLNCDAKLYDLSCSTCVKKDCPTKSLGHEVRVAVYDERSFAVTYLD